jgi:dihydrofolate reductase
MRKVKLQMQVSVDGLVAGPNGEQDWMVWDWDDVLKEYVTGLTDTSDTMLIGRVLYQGMATYWPAAAADPEGKDIEFAHKMNNIQKVVFSKTLSTVEWNNSRLAAGTLDDVVAKLKKMPGKDLIIYGGARIVSSFIKLGLIDEYHLFVNPVVLGNGMPIWKEIMERMKMKLIKTTVSNSGIVILCFQPDKK